jgi:hypothetical protein
MTVTPFTRIQPPRTAFVLSGGASLGALQVGMLRALYERGIAPDLLVGTSAGALNAAYVASRPQTVATASELTAACGTTHRVSHAIELGAQRIYVLPTAHPCARTLPVPPRGALDAAVHAFTLLLGARLESDLARYATAVSRLASAKTIRPTPRA